MVKICAVLGCNNEWYPGSDIIYHAFKGDIINGFGSLPTNIAQRNLWLSKVPLKNNLYECAKICSAHFKLSDYCSPASLKETATPILENDAICNLYENKLSLLDEACRICLAMDRKLFYIKKNPLCNCYEELTGLLLNDDDKLPQKLCWECAHKLISYKQFKTKALHSHDFMLGLLKFPGNNTQNTLASIEQMKHVLRSHLMVQYLALDQADCHIIEGEGQIPDFFKADANDETKSLDKINQVNLPECCFKQEISSDNSDENVPNNSDYPVKDASETIRKGHIAKTVHIELQEMRGGSSDTEDEGKTIKSEDIGRRKKRKIAKKVDKKTKAAKETLSEDMFEIAVLSKAEQIEYIEERRESENFKCSELRCNFCCKGFFYEYSYEQHMARHTEQAGPYECDVCKLRFPSAKTFGCHTRSHGLKFSCKQCPFVTTRRETALRHENFHGGKKYQCPQCSKQFLKVTTYMSHLRIHHPSDHICQLCGHSFIGEKGLAQHKNLKHRFDKITVPEDGPKCIPCNVTFVSKEVLETHIKASSRHESPRQRGRPLGSKKDDKISNVRKRMRRGKPKKSISCEQCDMELPNAVAYNIHFKNLHPNTNQTKYLHGKAIYMCEICGKMFKAYALLEDHRSSHEEAKQFKCSECGKMFQRRYLLSAHKRIHNSRNSHPCTVCDKRFSSAGNLVRHMATHTGFKPFQCEMCCRCFLYLSEKRLHVKHVHMKTPWPKRDRGKRKGNPKQEQLSPLQKEQNDTDAE